MDWSFSTAGTANESYGGSCCDRCGDTNNNQSDPPAGQRCDVETANKSHAGSCNESVPDEESISGCKSGDMNSQPTPHTNRCCNIKMSTVCHSVCAGPDDDNSGGLGCGGRCCAPPQSTLIQSPLVVLALCLEKRLRAKARAALPNYIFPIARV